MGRPPRRLLRVLLPQARFGGLGLSVADASLIAEVPAALAGEVAGAATQTEEIEGLAVGEPGEDCYSELRGLSTVDLPKPEMSYLGG